MLPVTLFDKDLCKRIEGRINMGPVNLVDLLPLFKSGYGNKEIIPILQQLDEDTSSDISPNYSEELQPLEVFIKLFGDVIQSCKEVSFVMGINFMYNTKVLTKENHTIYDFVRAVRSKPPGKTSQPRFRRKEFLEEFVCGRLPYLKADPLLISVILDKRNLTAKYSCDVRSNKVGTYKECKEISPDCCEIIKEVLVTRIFLYKHIFGADVSCYMFLNEVFLKKIVRDINRPPLKLFLFYR